MCEEESLVGVNLNLLILSRFPSTMPAGSFFPKGFDAPGARILPIRSFSHFTSFSLVMYLTLSFFFSFLFLFPSFLSLPPDLRFEEEC